MREMNIVSHCDYIEDEGRVELVFTPSIIPYISSLKTRFTKYQAKYVMPMRSGYGIRLYELCLQWLGDEREFEVDEFKELLGLGNQYPRLADLKRRVIRPGAKGHQRAYRYPGPLRPAQGRSDHHPLAVPDHPPG